MFFYCLCFKHSVGEVRFVWRSAVKHSPANDYWRWCSCHWGEIRNAFFTATEWIVIEFLRNMLVAHLWHLGETVSVIWNNIFIGENGSLSRLTDTSRKCVFWGTPTPLTDCVYSEYFYLVSIFFSRIWNSLFISFILMAWMAAETYVFLFLHCMVTILIIPAINVISWHEFLHTQILFCLHCLRQRDLFFCGVNLLSSWIQFNFPLLLQENITNVLAILLILVYVFKPKTGGRKYSLQQVIMSWMLL